MDEALQQFMHSTEEVAHGIVPPVSKTITYPFLYITKITEVELRYLVETGIVQRTAVTPEYLPFYLRTTGYKALGYIKLDFNSMIHLNYFAKRDVFLKASKEDERAVEEIFDSLLLT